MADVTWQRPDYTAALPGWKKADDIVFGRNLTAYLPQLNPTDTSKENAARNDEYRERAVFYGFAGYTFKGMVGACFAKDPSLTLPPVLEYLDKTADGLGNSIYQQAQSVTGDVIRKGRAGLFVAFPQVDGASRADMASGKSVATIHHVAAESIINWRYERQGAKMVLSLIVFAFTEDRANGFEAEEVKKYRVLSLEEGIYWDRTYTSDGGQLVLEANFSPLDGSGNNWREIPFIFVGSENNDASIDPPPLDDLIRLNIGHFRNSADYEDSVFYSGQPQPWASGIDQTWNEMANKAGFYIGSRALMPVPSGETFGFASAPPNPLVSEAMREKVQQMIALGARIVQPGSAVKTATQSQSESAVQHSVLSLIVANVTEAYLQCLKWCADYMGAPDTEIEFEISRDFGFNEASPQMLMAMVAAWNQGALPTGQLWQWLRAHGLIPADMTDEELQDGLDVLPAFSNPDSRAVAI